MNYDMHTPKSSKSISITQVVHEAFADYVNSLRSEHGRFVTANEALRTLLAAVKK
ncbi:hypothetical protein Q5H92_13780 [Hymenobacter sp. M29]|uniref:CopG family transcriptional regulator n=1 Tax=Hymenobacter mellowenesis TaxID=3063995 RepID=A0ABT9AC68_9BACT|nr:hypothetical protein [Hymenobacter sp. M29]MDO7847435.1 hypothetical protein [Hymenobacter sp. M29]